MLRVTITVAMILAIVLLVVKTSVVRLPAMPGLRKSSMSCSQQRQSTPDGLMAMLAG